ncbi:LysR family transcriptional regulator [Amphritea sp. HPY]|uniref:LysR family transcriptional regulator n=1 Tax=Amphritea sp. HPY TaxID=3421652 RepID=UPI003D7C621B
MASLDQLSAFVIAAEQGSFSAAARNLGKAQSAVSTAINNLELDTGVELFDRSSRNPVLTVQGEALLAYAKTVLQSQHEFMVHALSLSHSEESKLCLAIEQSISGRSVLSLLHEFEKRYPHIELELLDPGSSDVAELIRTNRADIGLMLEREIYPQGFSFSGVGYSSLIPVCHHQHPLVSEQPLTHARLRNHRQLVTRSIDLEDRSHERHMFSPKVWLSESPYIILELLCNGMGWAFLHEAVVREKLDSGELVALKLSYQQTDILQGVDVVWTENRQLGPAGSWLQEQLMALEIGVK